MPIHCNDMINLSNEDPSNFGRKKLLMYIKISQPEFQINVNFFIIYTSLKKIRYFIFDCLSLDEQDECTLKFISSSKEQ